MNVTKMKTAKPALSNGGALATPRPLTTPLMRGGGGQRRARAVRVQALPDFFKALFDYKLRSWAPKSSRIWRLQQYQYPEADALERGADSGGDGAALDAASMQVLRERLAELRDSKSDAGSSGRDSGSSSISSSSGGSGVAAAFDDDGDMGAGAAARSFSDADDDELSTALSKRAVQLATGGAGDTGSMDGGVEPLTGQEMQELLMSKYGRLYDLSFAKRAIPGKTFVALNIMWVYMGQRSFKLTPEQYAEKLDGAAALVNTLGQTDRVRAFLRAPARSQKGLPRRPVVGTAISIQLDLSEAQVREWFGSGYD